MLLCLRQLHHDVPLEADETEQLGVDDPAAGQDDVEIRLLGRGRHCEVAREQGRQACEPRSTGESAHVLIHPLHAFCVLSRASAESGADSERRLPLARGADVRFKRSLGAADTPVGSQCPSSFREISAPTWATA